ncbi:2,3-dihydro-2,3-dihydroxybenzoate dehydrogenase [enterobactin] siderophore [Cronobacter malonaticus 507]|nr:2,3-dihydro-2,3-dihydroxybenzoate dehydrogenase [enterobactin] siderophore [Cronobacter malonaticus 507]
MTLDFQGKNVWVTGAGKGIGYTTALAFAGAGANVTGFDLAFSQADYPFACETVRVIHNIIGGRLRAVARQ